MSTETLEAPSVKPQASQGIELEQFADAVTLGEERLLASGDYDFAAAKAHALFRAWAPTFIPTLASHDVLEVESEFSFPLLNPESEAPSKTFVEAGKIDGVLRHKASGTIKTLEHKTTSDSIAPDSNYWPRLIMDTQPSKYILSLQHRGIVANSALYNVVSKPAQRPKGIPILDDEGRKIVLDAGGQRVFTKDGKKPRETGSPADGYFLQTREETPEEFHHRILDELTGSPGDYFAQREIPRQDRALLEYMEDAWALSQQILYFRRSNLWPRNPSACTQFGTCEFFDLCSGRASVDGIRYAAKPKRHAELETPENGKEFLTNSRLSALRKCSRYHFHRYEQPIKPIRDEDEALRIGSAFHVAVEAFLATFLVK